MRGEKLGITHERSAVGFGLSVLLTLILMEMKSYMCFFRNIMIGASQREMFF
jgi:hypothetical protein